MFAPPRIIFKFRNPPRHPHQRTWRKNIKISPNSLFEGIEEGGDVEDGGFGEKRANHWYRPYRFRRCSMFDIRSSIRKFIIQNSSLLINGKLSHPNLQP